jgi:tetratricopeptide (TPR) repeat protein
VTEAPTAVALARISSLCDLGRFADAAREAAAFLRTDPDNDRALCLLAQARLGIHDPVGALLAARAAAAAAPHAEWPHRLPSVALMEIGDPSDAVAEAETAVALAPFDPLPRVQLAHAERKRGGDLSAARRAADEAIALAPHLVEAHLAVGVVAAAQGYRDEAEHAFRVALRLDPSCSAAHNELARLQLRGRYSGAASLAAAATGFARAVRADPTAQVSRRNLDLVVFLFVRRISWLVFIAGWIGNGLGSGTDVPRAALWLPLALLAIPAAFAVGFVVRLPQSLRAYLLGSLRRPVPGLPVAGLVGAAVLLGVGAAVPVADVDKIAFTGALLLALGIRWALWSHGRRAGFVVARRRG